MKFIVGILAALSITGCGVGVDDPEGLAAAGYAFGSTTSALTSSGSEQGSESGQAVTSAVSGTASTATVITVQSGVGADLTGGGTVSAPQDPIPALEAKANDPNAPFFGIGGLPGPGPDPRTGK